MNLNIKRGLAAVGALAVTAANAAVPDGAAAAITGYQTDTVTVIGLLIAAGIAIMAAQKLGRKMGWI